ncbi:MAG: S-methyl-5-thioribose-1-phosphate isomerase [Planctomycetota bacterium]
MFSLRWVGSPVKGFLKLIDQTKLPHKLTYVNCRTLPQIIYAIKTLQVRGAPAIGVTAGFGAFIAARSIKTNSFRQFYELYNSLTNQLISSRPTAVNLKWAVDRINRLIPAVRNKPIAVIKAAIFAEAMRIFREDLATCDALGRNGAKLIRNDMSILTHCNTGFLATAGAGTALSVIYRAKKQSKRFRVFATETRPLLQGARLTAWELKQSRIDVTLLCDTMAGSLMSAGKVDLVLVGADRIAANGDTANKIGTYQLALMARYHRIPFYVVAPMSTFDFKLKSGKQIPIEFRSPDEVTHLAGKRIAPVGVKAYNPAFDVTPAKLITGWVTEKGIILPQRHGENKFYKETRKPRV